LCGVFFFFSSRRRHTRSKRDWSSDVCSSDLGHCFADRSGLEAVTMRAVAAELDGVAAALYRHVRGRDELIDLIRDEVLAERRERSEERRVGEEGRERAARDATKQEEEDSDAR